MAESGHIPKGELAGAAAGRSGESSKVKTVAPSPSPVGSAAPVASSLGRQAPGTVALSLEALPTL